MAAWLDRLCGGILETLCHTLSRHADRDHSARFPVSGRDREAVLQGAGWLHARRPQHPAGGDLPSALYARRADLRERRAEREPAVEPDLWLAVRAVRVRD